MFLKLGKWYFKQITRNQSKMINLMKMYVHHKPTIHNGV